LGSRESEIALGWFFPGFFPVVGSMAAAQANLPVGFLTWVMIIPVLVREPVNSIAPNPFLLPDDTTPTRSVADRGP